MALSNGEVRLYDESRELLHTLRTREAIAGIRFGPYAREEGALAIVSVSGKLSIFMLHRKAELRKVSSGDGVSAAGPGDGDKSALHPSEQDIPLKVRWRSRLHMDIIVAHHEGKTSALTWASTTKGDSSHEMSVCAKEPCVS